jgi:hypothetical protein
MKVSDDELRRRLTLIESSKTFVLKEVGDDGTASVQTCQVIPNDDGIYWVHGKTKLKNGRELPSVFRVDTNAAGDLLSVYWLLDGDWYEHDSADTFSALGIERDDAFPFDWSYTTPLENDAFHS